VKGEVKEPKRDLQERTFEFARRVVKLCQELYQMPGVNRLLAVQLLRSGASIGANVEEGQAGQSRADFISKYSIACKEARETHYWLRLLVASDIAIESELQEMIDEANQFVAILITIIKTSKNNSERRN
jgi:four helix bundle protein